MTSVLARAAAALSLAAVLAACGATSLTRDDAMKAAMDAVTQDVADPGSVIYRHRVELRTATEVTPKRWLVVIRDHTDDSLICVTVVSQDGAIVPTANVAAKRCSRDTPEHIPTTSNPSSA